MDYCERFRPCGAQLAFATSDLLFNHTGSFSFCRYVTLQNINQERRENFWRDSMSLFFSFLPSCPKSNFEMIVRREMALMSIDSKFPISKFGVANAKFPTHKIANSSLITSFPLKKIPKHEISMPTLTAQACCVTFASLLSNLF